MSTQDFLENPWGQGRSHRAFEKSSFNIRPAPEFATGEVVMSSLYRSAGFGGIAEREVKGFGDKLSKAADQARKKALKDDEIQPDTWRTVLDRLVQSPKVAKQSSKRFMSLSPVVPDTALYSGSARLSGNAWNPGQLVKRIIQLGAPSEERAKETWRRLYVALGTHFDDDVWARWLQWQFELHKQAEATWAPTELSETDALPDDDRKLFDYPAKQFVADLDGIIGAKGSMTRRQWVSLLEAVLRIGTVSHVLWLCDVNDRIWGITRKCIEGDEFPVASARDVATRVLTVRKRMLSFGNPAVPTLRDYASKYLTARLGLNLTLWMLADFGVPTGALDSTSAVFAFFRAVREHKHRLRSANLMETYLDLQDREERTITCKKGVGANLVEFTQYTLGQRQTMDETLRGYDQGYFLRKRGAARNSPWVLAMGPAAVLAMAHCCLHEIEGPRSVQRLANHLAAYGIEFDLHGLNDSDLGRQLRMLGLVLDSPDAESGMLLVPPFAA